ncbi:hypothetical protein QP027_07380 [Corynebacterium breve]|uniref:Uncharacterized protein n=1 Tax=Corynebacterium breve TaxID=3049799 RepID=A0ABY8VDY2_9CORY|nr:hypothetical protein [Corynebacterium breve]WIM66955.1 hypothetical protein QP027_07380 [Corynebacterium breve]
MTDDTANPPLPAWLAVHIGRTPVADAMPINRAGMNRLLKSAKIPVNFKATSVAYDDLSRLAAHAHEDAAAATELMMGVIAAYSGSSMRNNKARLNALKPKEAREQLRVIAERAHDDVQAAYSMFRTGSRNTFSHIGPAIFTRFLTQVTAGAFILDSRVATLLNRAGVAIDPAGPWSAAAYGRYIDTLYSWAGEHHDPADIELALLYAPLESEETVFTGDTSRILAHLLGVARPAPTTWGLATLDKKFGPLQPGTVCLVYGETNSGVSSFLRTVALGNARRGVTVDYITDLDTGTAWALLIAGVTGIPPADLTNRDNATRFGTMVDKAPLIPGKVRILNAPDPESRADVLIDDRRGRQGSRRQASVPAPRHGVAQLARWEQANPPERVDAFLRVERPDLEQPDHQRAGEIDVYDVVNNRSVILGNALHFGRVVDLGKR